MTKPTFAQLKASAARAGYTRRVIVEYGDKDLYGWIRPNANLSGAFTLIEDEGGQILNLDGAEDDGYAVNVRDLED